MCVPSRIYPAKARMHPDRLTDDFILFFCPGGDGFQVGCRAYDRWTHISARRTQGMGVKKSERLFACTKFQGICTSIFGNSNGRELLLDGSNTFRRWWMSGEKSRVWRACGRFHSFESVEELEKAARVPAGPQGLVETETVGFELIMLTESKASQECDSGAEVLEDLFEGFVLASEIFEERPEERLRLQGEGELVESVSGDDMADLMGEDGGELVFGGKDLEHTAMDIDGSTGKRDSVGRRQVDNFDAIRQGGPAAAGGKLTYSLVQVLIDERTDEDGCLCLEGCGKTAPERNLLRIGERNLRCVVWMRVVPQKRECGAGTEDQGCGGEPTLAQP